MIESFPKLGSCSEEERLRAQQEITSKEEMLAAERRERQRLAAQLAAMEEKLVVGHADEETVRKREEDLLRAQVELEERRREQEVLNERLREKEEMAAENESKYADIKEEAEVKTKKLKKLWKKYEETKRDVEDLQQTFRDERDELYESVREQERQLKLLNLIVSNFVPPEEKRKLESRCIYDEVRPHTRSLLHARSLAPDGMLGAASEARVRYQHFLRAVAPGHAKLADGEGLYSGGLDETPHLGDAQRQASKLGGGPCRQQAGH